MFLIENNLFKRIYVSENAIILFEGIPENGYKVIRIIMQGNKYTEIYTDNIFKIWWNYYAGANGIDYGSNP